MFVVVDGLKIAYRRHAATPAAGVTPVLFVHGATFPGSLAVGWAFEDGRSWSSDLAERGHDIWSLDFAGYGQSDRDPSMGLDAAICSFPAVPGRSSSAVRQVLAVVDAIRETTGVNRVALLAHSWGGLVACRFAAEHPERVERLCLFAPILRRTSIASVPSEAPSWFALTVQQQIDRFREDVPTDEPPLITDAMAARWGEAYLATDAGSRARSPASVAVPGGPRADILAAWAGELPYDPARIVCPVSVLRGAWDRTCTDADVVAFRGSLTRAPMFRGATLERGTHLMHLETGRQRLWTAARNALVDALHAPLATHAVFFEVLPTADGLAPYLARAGALRPVLDEIDGFQTIDRLGSRTRPGWVLSFQTWLDDAAIASWRSHERHVPVQRFGREVTFEDYRLRVGRLVRDSGAPAARQPRGDATYADPARRRPAFVGVVEFTSEHEPTLASLVAARESETFDSLYRPGHSMLVRGLPDKIAAIDWFDRVLASAAQRGDGVRIRLFETLRDYGMFDRGEAPQYAPPVARARVA